MEQCKHEMNPAWCALCLGRVARRDSLAEEVVSVAFVSRYQGCCAVCDGEITPGEMVCRVRQHPDDSGEVVHEDCADRGDLYV